MSTKPNHIANPLTWIITGPTTPIGCCVFAWSQGPGLRCVQLRRQPGRRRACRSVKVTKQYHSICLVVSHCAIVTSSSRRSYYFIKLRVIQLDNGVKCIGLLHRFYSTLLELFLLSFYDIRLQKMSWPWNWGQRSLKVIESDIIW